MAALTQGKKAPEIKLVQLDGGQFSLEQARKQGHVLVVFFKVSCLTCQYALPFHDRLAQAFAGDKVTVIGVSQDNADATRAFAREFGVDFPLVLDDSKGYIASNSYGITNVPTFFLVTPGGEIAMSSVSWSREDFDELSAELARISGRPDREIFREGEKVLDFKPG